MRYILIFLFFSVGSFAQINPTTWYNFGGREVKVNTYIGGIGGTINTKELLASKLGIPAYRIKKFKITGVDIECAIVGSYNIVSAFYYDGVNQVTYFRDDKGLVLGLGLRAFYNTRVNDVIIPNATYISEAAFDQNITFFNDLKILYIPKVTTIGLNALNNNVFRSGNLGGGKIYANPFLQTSNSGGVEGDLAYLATGNTIVYVTDFTPPNPITSLANGTVTSTTIPVTFTPPTGSTNAVDFYEVYLNGRYYQKLTSNTITGLTSGSSYSIKIMTRDIFYNGSLSNEITVSTL